MIRSLVVSLLKTGVVIVLSALLWQISAPLGSLALLAFSFWMMLASYRREWRLHWLTCLLPAATAAGCYWVQSSLLAVKPDAVVLAPAVIIGGLLGLLQGVGHKTFVRGRAIFAKKTTLFLLAWAISFLLTQLCVLAGAGRMSAWGMTVGAFSTAAIAAASVVLLLKYAGKRGQATLPPAAGGPPPVRTAMIVLLSAGAALLPFTSVVTAQQEGRLAGVVRQIVSADDLTAVGLDSGGDLVEQGRSSAIRSFFLRTAGFSQAIVGVQEFADSRQNVRDAKAMYDRGVQSNSVEAMSEGDYSFLYRDAAGCTVTICKGQYRLAVRCSLDEAYLASQPSRAAALMRSAQGSSTRLAKALYPRFCRALGLESPPGARSADAAAPAQPPSQREILQRIINHDDLRQLGIAWNQEAYTTQDDLTIRWFGVSNVPSIEQVMVGISMADSEQKALDDARTEYDNAKEQAGQHMEGYTWHPEVTVTKIGYGDFAFVVQQWDGSQTAVVCQGRYHLRILINLSSSWLGDVSRIPDPPPSATAKLWCEGLLRSVYPRFAKEIGSQAVAPSGLSLDFGPDEVKAALTLLAGRLFQGRDATSPDVIDAVDVAIAGSGMLLLAALLTNMLNSLGMSLAQAVGSMAPAPPLPGPRFEAAGAPPRPTGPVMRPEGLPPPIPPAPAKPPPVAPDAQTPATAGQSTADAVQASRNKELLKRYLAMLRKQGGDGLLNQYRDAHVSADLGEWDSIALKYRSMLQDQVRAGNTESAGELRWASWMGWGETGMKVTVAAAKVGLVVVGGHIAATAQLAGIGAAALGSGAVEGAGAGAEAVVDDRDAMEVLKRTGVGFLTGAKDGAISTFTNLPGTSLATKVFLPTAADVGEVYIKTGDERKALFSGAVEAASNLAGAGLDGVTPGGWLKQVTKETGETLLAGTTAGAKNVYVNDGEFSDAFTEGALNSLGGKAGRAAAGHAASRATDVHETNVRAANDEFRAAQQQKVGIDDLPRSVRDCADSLHREPAGDGTEKSYVDPAKALKQLQNPADSRVAKRGPADVSEAIINTRRDKLYSEPDGRTIDAAQKRLAQAAADGETNIYRPGDKLRMDTFSTPGAGKPSLGADRDARLVIERTDAATGKTQLIEVPRKYWEAQAYKDFHDHSMSVLKHAGVEITHEEFPRFYRKLEELQYLKGAGFTDEQIRHRAWADGMNQLFTDGTHIEASMDNTDQLVRFVRSQTGELQSVHAQQTPQVVQAQKHDGTLIDADGYARMWTEKSQTYQDIPTEAIAQSQKGIGQYLKLREGYRMQGLVPPPIQPQTARAMEIILRAPSDSTAAPEAVAAATKQLQAEGFAGLGQAMDAIATQNEILKWSRPVGTVGASTIATMSKPWEETAT